MSELGDDDKTVLPGLLSARLAIAPGPDASTGPEEHNALPIGSRIAEFEVKAVIGVGGFGIVYLAHDHSLGRDVALKEYLPTSLASRNGLNVSVKTARHADTFAAGLASFINEAKILAQFDNPSLVKVYRFWSANGTAYMVMPYYEGPTLKQALAQASERPTEQWLKDILAPLSSALELLHSENYFHRDIAPDNILLVKGKRPVLLDFGAARRVIVGTEKALTVILKPGFAPVEQYFDSHDMTQGAWTDIYALGAVMHYAIMGKAPVPSVGRLIKDTAIPIAQAAAGRYTDAFLHAIDRALAVRPEQRPQGMAEFRELLGLHDAPLDDLPRRIEKRTGENGNRKLLVAGGILGIAAVVVAARMFMTGNQESVGSKTESIPGQAVVSAPLRPQAPVTATVQSQGQMQTLPPPPLAVAVDANRTFTPVEALAQVYELRERDHAVTVNSEKTTVRVGKDKLRFQVESSKSGYLYILMLGTDKRHISLLFPNSLDQKNQTKSGQPVKLPRAGWAMTADGPPGTNEFVAIVSEWPRDFAQLGLTQVGPFAEVSLEKVTTLLRSNTGGHPVLAGTPVCASAAGCSAAYGAARFTIQEVR